ncbi:MAG TPA: beta-glucosidase, partial [Chitinophagaceae bacterium]|nr:beta-glucosidase [Chitinophagaceae bacterium]
MNRLLIFILLSISLIACDEPQQQSTSSFTDEIPAPDNLTDSALFRLVQERYFQYFWEGSEPMSGLGRERLHMDNIYPENDKHIVTSGGAGFGVMAIIVGIE